MLSGSVSKPPNLVEILRWRALHQPERLAYTFLKDGELEEASLRYDELDRWARGIGSMLQQYGAGGERVLLIYPPGIEYIVAFFGCLYAGAVAVPTYPPRLNRSLFRLQAIVNDAQAKVALTTTSLLARIEPLLDQTPLLKEVHWLAADRLEADLADEWREPCLGRDSLAFLQYTSGSTAAPKGVMVTHGNLLHNERLIQESCGHTEESTFVGWLPLYHDMGLIGNVLQPLFIGAPGVLMSPVAFLQSPLRWLLAISRYRAATSGGPNFAYDLCASRVNPGQPLDLDLSSWRVAFNGAEPVRHETMERFAATFAPYGFRRGAFLPCYGLAEATLFVTGGSPGRAMMISRSGLAKGRATTTLAGDNDGQSLVSCGYTSCGQKVIVADPETMTSCPEGEVGEVWISGESVAAGYWSRSEETERVFRARLVETGEGPFLRTGDLGFLHNGELYLTGRLKDLIIIRGRNYYPQDIELTVERCHTELRPGCGAAFSVEISGQERLVCVQEVQTLQSASTDLIIDCIRRAVFDEHELQPYAVTLIRRGTIPKTSSGKIQRHACRNEFLTGELSVIGEWREQAASGNGAPLSPHPTQFRTEEDLESWLRSLLAGKLGATMREIDSEAAISRYGVDSLTAAELSQQIEIELGIKTPQTFFLQGLTFSQLAAELFARRSEMKLHDRARAAGVAESTNESSLSHGQRALYFLHQLDPEETAYNIARAIRLKPSVRIDLLRQAFQILVNRWSALRTVFVIRKGEPRQIVHPKVDVFFREIDVPDWDEGLLRKKMSEESRRPFNLEQGPLLKLFVFAKPQGERVLLLAIHHIISDFWSLAILMQELEIVYAALESGSEPILPDPGVEQVDYVRRQEELLSSAEGERLWAYWRDQLSGRMPVLELPTDRPRKPGQAYRRCASRSLEIDARLTQALKELSQNAGATLFTTLLAAYQILLHRYTGQERVLVGSPFSGRTSGGLAATIGYFVNPAPLQADFTGDPLFIEFLGQIRRTTLGALEHQDYPFSLMVERLQPDRELGRAALFQTMFVMQKTPGAADQGLALLAAGLTDVVPLSGKIAGETVPLEQEATQFDLTLNAVELSGRIMASLQYDVDLFDLETAERILSNFYALLVGIAADPRRRISDIPFPTEAEERAAALRHGLDRERFVTEGAIHQWFEAQVERTPDAVALVCEEQQLTYRELNRRADRLAHYLNSFGVKPETPTGLLTERSPEMVIGMLGVMKSGGAYIPLDPTYPPERATFTLKDARVEILLTQRSLQERVDGSIKTVICLESEWDRISESETLSRSSRVEAENLAYVIYTSGSTGRPKGVAVTHANVLRLFAATRDWFNFNERDVWTLFHSQSFDFSVWEIWGALIHGGRLVMVPYEVSRTPAEFFQLLNREQVTVLNQTPFAFRQLMQAEQAIGENINQSLRLIIFGGEALDFKSLEPWYARRGDEQPQLVNMYGITETTVHTTYRPIRSVDSIQASGSLIGGVIPDLYLPILDRYGHLAPTGAKGEIHVGGSGLARGYLNRPELTAERFTPDPFGDDPGARLYRTGDVARRLNSGDLEYLGRADHQVKIRGFRIELGEVEAALRDLPVVRDAVVLVREDRPGEKRLVAYVVFFNGREQTISELRRSLMAALPEYMTPTLLVRLDSLPFTSHGKIDRAALLSLDIAESIPTQTFVAAQEKKEKVLAEIWAEALGRKIVGLQDNFFELGGDSIRSIQVKSRAEEQGIHFSLQQLFQHQTISELLSAIDDNGGDVELSPTQAFSLISDDDRLRLSDDVEDAYPLTKLQMGLVFHSEHSSDYETYVTSFHLRARLDVPTFRDAAQILAAGHGMLRTSFDLTGFSEPLQLVHERAVVPIEMDDLSHLSTASQESFLISWLAERRKDKFDWTRHPLLRIYIHRRSPSSFQFTLSEPFLDGWSVASFCSELFAVYASLMKGPGGLPNGLAPAVAFRDYAALERQALTAEGTRLFWEQKLSDQDGSRLPRWSKPSAAPGAPAVKRLNIPIPAEVSEKLKELALSLSVPLKSVLLAAHLKVVSCLSGNPKAISGLLYNGRPETVDGDRTLGLFLNAVPILLRFTGGTWSDLIYRIFEAERELLPFRRYPLAEIRRIRGGRTPFDTVFNFTHFHAYQKLRDVRELEVLDFYASEQTYFDLTVQFNLDHDSDRSAIRLALDYRTSELPEEQVSAMGDSYLRVLAALADKPLGRHESISLLSEKERRLLVEWNETQKDYGEERPIHELFEAQAERAPDAVALVFEEKQLSYRELNRRANALARRLKNLGVEPERIVGVLMERSPELIIGLLAVLKSGAAYMPIDPSYPMERQAFMIEDACVQVLLTQNAWPALAKQNVSVVCLDEETPYVAGEGNLNEQVELDALAYVIYTSGSTGRPKAVMSAHRGILNRLLWMQDAFGLTATDQVLQKTSVSFDVSVWELFWPLITGARLVVARPGGHQDCRYLIELIKEQKITTLHFVPSMLQLFLEEPEVEECVSLKRVVCSGEALPSDLALRFFSRLAVGLYNLYGPTEASVDVTWRPCAKDEGLDSVPIGRPITNTQIYALDGHSQPSPLGLAGELHIGGVGLARGYLGRPELTAERFIPDPYGTVLGGRLYRTGDLTRYLPNGDLEFLGRVDRQIKLHGLRIELGEIEAALRKHPEVREAVVLVEDERQGKKKLVAYVTPGKGRLLNVNELRQFLKDKLPMYLTPHIFIVLPELPLTTNGKLDYRKLSRQEHRHSGEQEMGMHLLERLEKLSDEQAKALLAELESIESVGRGGVSA